MWCAEMVFDIVYVCACVGWSSLQPYLFGTLRVLFLFAFFSVFNLKLWETTFTFVERFFQSEKEAEACGTGELVRLLLRAHLRRGFVE